MKLVGFYYLAYKSLIHSCLLVILIPISSVCKYCSYLNLRIQLFEYFVVMQKHRYRLRCEQSIIFSIERGLVEVVENELCNLSHSNLIHIINRQVFTSFIILHKKAQNILIGYRIFNQVFVHTISEDFFCGYVLFCIFHKYRSSCKTKDLQVVKEADNILMAISKLATVAFVENHNNFLIANVLQMFIVIISCYSRIQLLDSCNDNL